jgi:hypothetical protein
VSDRVFGPAVEPGGPGAGVQLWWDVPKGVVPVAASAVLELLQPPVSGRRYRFGLQAGVLDEEPELGQRVAVAVVEADSLLAGVPRRLELHRDAGLTDPAVWMELDQPPDDPTVVARWSSLSLTLDDGSCVPVASVLVTFPAGSDWKRLDVALDDVGVLQVTNTRRRTPNLAVLRLPAAR